MKEKTQTNTQNPTKPMWLPSSWHPFYVNQWHKHWLRRLTAHLGMLKILGECPSQQAAWEVGARQGAVLQGCVSELRVLGPAGGWLVTWLSWQGGEQSPIFQTCLCILLNTKQVQGVQSVFLLFRWQPKLLSGKCGLFHVFCSPPSLLCLPSN